MLLAPSVLVACRETLLMLFVQRSQSIMRISERIRLLLCCAFAFGFTFLGASVAAAVASDVSAAAILDVFPPSVAKPPSGRVGETKVSTKYQPSGSVWDQRLDESQVFQFEMKHQQSADDSYALRVGKGGQIYSLRGPFGESLPPSWRAKGRPISAWNDEVWQFVAVCTRYNGIEAIAKEGRLTESALEKLKQSPYQTGFFIHNSGTYGALDGSRGTIYCPLLGTEIDEGRRTIRTLNWGLVPQMRTIHRSPILYYMQVRDIGDGIIELTWVVHNFSERDDVVFDHLNAPWGGTRVSSLPYRYVSSPAGVPQQGREILSDSGIAYVEKTGGWNLSCASQDADCPSLALVFGRDRHLQEERDRMSAGKPYCQHDSSLYREWRPQESKYENGAWSNWQTRPANTFRNYDVCEVIPKLRIVPQTSVWYRSYLVVNWRERAIELAKSLVEKVDYGLLTFNTAATPMRRASIRDGIVDVDAADSKSNNAFQVFARPVEGSRPLFLIRNTKTNQQIITTDPYYFVKKEKLDLGDESKPRGDSYYQTLYGYSMDENNSDWQALVGFGFVKKPATGSWKRLSELVDRNHFPEADPFHLDLWVSTAIGSAH